MYIPKNINTWDKLQTLLSFIHTNGFTGNILFYTPWDNISSSLKKCDFRVNLFDVPEAYHILNEDFFDNTLPQLNYSPTLVEIWCDGDEAEGWIYSARVVDNRTAVQYELTSGD